MFITNFKNNNLPNNKIGKNLICQKFLNSDRDGQYFGFNLNSLYGLLLTYMKNCYKILIYILKIKLSVINQKDYN